MKTNCTISKVLRGSAVMLLMLAVTAGAFATLGDGKSKTSRPAKKSLLSAKSSTNTGSFSLRSGYNFRGSQVINSENSAYINLNTVATYQKGQTTYIVPIKKKVILNNKVTFNPNAATRR